MPNLEALVQTVSKRIHTSSKYTARLQRHVFERLAQGSYPKRACRESDRRLVEPKSSALTIRPPRHTRIPRPPIFYQCDLDLNQSHCHVNRIMCNKIADISFNSFWETSERQTCRQTKPTTIPFLHPAGVCLRRDGCRCQKQNLIGTIIIILFRYEQSCLDLTKFTSIRIIASMSGSRS